MDNMVSLLNDISYYPENVSDRYFNKDGKAVPRVTEILSAMMHSDNLMYWANSLGLKGIRYKEALNKAANIGTVAHDQIESFLKKKLNTSDNTCFLGFLMWYGTLEAQGHILELVGSEQKITCDWFGGTYDALIRIDGKLYLVDFKTSNHITEKYFLQLGAYSYMLENMGYKIDGYIVLQLNKDTPGFNEYLLVMDNLEHYGFMRNCINCYLSLVYAYYNVALIRKQYKAIF